MDRRSLHFVAFPAQAAACAKAVTQPAKLVTLDRLLPNQHYRKDQISPRLWPNGKMPEREDWKQLLADNFKDYKLKVSGLIENPVELSLVDLRSLGGEGSSPCIIASRDGQALRNGAAFR